MSSATNPLAAYDLTGRVAVITGAASGIGAATADALSAVGAKIVAADLNGEGAQATAAAIRDRGGAAIGVPTNVTRKAEVDALVDRAVADFGHVDILCNVAGAMFPGLLEAVTEEQIDAGIALNLKGVLFGCQAAMRVMKPRRSGAIVNVSSAAIDAPFAGIGIYALTKAAVAMLSMTLAKEAGPYGIRVNAIAPGSTLTPFTTWRLHNADGSLNQEAYDTFVEQMKTTTPLGTMGEAVDQAQLILFLVSDAGRWATGNIHRVNGGQAMAW